MAGKQQPYPPPPPAQYNPSAAYPPPPVYNPAWNTQYSQPIGGPPGAGPSGLRGPPGPGGPTNVVVAPPTVITAGPGRRNRVGVAGAGAGAAAASGFVICMVVCFVMFGLAMVIIPVIVFTVVAT